LGVTLSGVERWSALVAGSVEVEAALRLAA
jgi:hypothetical protein